MPALVLLLLVLGCGAGSKEKDPAAASRVAAVKASPEAAGVSTGKWTDVSFPAASAPTMELPPVVPARANGSLPAFPRDRWVWLNVWATWCGPCVKEMPMMEEWRARLQGEGVPVDLWYLSVDEQEVVLGNFLRQRSGLAPGVSLRLKTYDTLFPWLERYQIDPQLGIPIHMLIAPGGKVRYVHVSQLRDTDYRIIKELLQ
ncbi:MAG: TlpA family protein disulfide reductase [Candidatus Latescibacteria bacterium]|nr:TlpA family protein disulfide reductase [Candidatus Latescibacterota bacterium]